MLSKKSQSAERLISRKKTKQTTIAIPWTVSAITEVTGEFSA
jgi:hypothetical protein